MIYEEAKSSFIFYDFSSVLNGEPHRLSPQTAGSPHTVTPTSLTNCSLILALYLRLILHPDNFVLALFFSLVTTCPVSFATLSSIMSGVAEGANSESP